MIDETLYNVLGVDKDATGEEIEHAHYSLQAKFKNRNKNKKLTAEEREVLKAEKTKVSIAYKVLIDEHMRGTYNERLKLRVNRGPRVLGYDANQDDNNVGTPLAMDVDEDAAGSDADTQVATDDGAKAAMAETDSEDHNRIAIMDHPWGLGIELSTRFKIQNWERCGDNPDPNSIRIVARLIEKRTRQASDKKDIRVIVRKTDHTRRVSGFQSLYKHRMMIHGPEIILIVRVTLATKPLYWNGTTEFSWDFETPYCVPPPGTTNYASAMFFVVEDYYQQKLRTTSVPRYDDPVCPEYSLVRDIDLWPKDKIGMSDMKEQGETVVPYEKGVEMKRFAAFAFSTVPKPRVRQPWWGPREPWWTKYWPERYPPVQKKLSKRYFWGIIRVFPKYTF